MSCSKLVNIEKQFRYFFILTTSKIFNYKETFFIFYFAKSNSFEAFQK